VTRYRRPAAYIRLARGSPPDALAVQEAAIAEAARRHGWAEPAVYLDIGHSGAGQGTGPALAQLTAAISTGRHDALILGGIGTICASPQDLMRLLSGCARHSVAVECVTPAPPRRGDIIGLPRQRHGGHRG
jgi:DNA invertase Pin-like site-specific DNA recombinase